MTKTQFDPFNYVKQGLSLELIEQIKKAFDLFDLQQTGYVSTKQIQAAMMHFNFHTKSNAIYQMISDLDSNENINFEQWLDLMTPKATNTSTRAHLSRVFQMYDEERTGFISSTSIKRVAKDLGIFLSDRQIEEMIMMADLDQDGVVAEDEFYHLMTYRR